jgi:hypothetical protein
VESQDCPKKSRVLHRMVECSDHGGRRRVVGRQLKRPYPVILIVGDRAQDEAATGGVVLVGVETVLLLHHRQPIARQVGRSEVIVDLVEHAVLEVQGAAGLGGVVDHLGGTRTRQGGVDGVGAQRLEIFGATDVAQVVHLARGRYDH